MEDLKSSQPVERAPEGSRSTGRRQRQSLKRFVKMGCLGLLLVLCGGVGLLGWALQSGPLTLNLVGNNVLRLGSDDFVLSNYSFQNGTTYYVDLNGNDVRNILQLHYIEDSHRLELVLHYASKSEMNQHRIAEMSLP